MDELYARRGEKEMKIMKNQLRKIIKEETQKVLKEEEANFDPATGKPLTDQGWKIAAKNPQHPFHKQAKDKVGDGRPVISGEESKKRDAELLATLRELRAGQLKLKGAVQKMPKGMNGISDLQKKMGELSELIGTYWTSWDPRRKPSS